MTNERDREMCIIALDEAFKLCGNPESTFQQTAVIMGMNKADIDAVTPLAQNYSRIVSVKPDREPRSEQRWVLARAWELTTRDRLSVMEAFEAAWAELAEITQPKPQPLAQNTFVAPLRPVVPNRALANDEYDDDDDEFPSN
jgi:hypothetical protein